MNSSNTTEPLDQTAPDSRSPDSRSRLADWAQLVRLPNVFTVIADVSAAFLFVGHGPEPIGRFVAIVVAGIFLYWGGMILNDVMDVEQDRQERSSRPLAAGHISVRSATIAAIAMLALGVIVAGTAGFIPGQSSIQDALPATWLPLGVAVALILMIWAYDGPLKATPIAPAAMGACRVLSFLLGASPHYAHFDGFPPWVIGLAIGMGAYVMGVTLIGRREAVGDRTPNLFIGVLVVVIGGVLIALAPRMAIGGRLWGFDPETPFSILIAMIVFPVAFRGWQAINDPCPAMIQTAVKSGVLTIIPLSAAIAFLGAGQFWGMAIFVLVLPSFSLASRFRVT